MLLKECLTRIFLKVVVFDNGPHFENWQDRARFEVRCDDQYRFEKSVEEGSSNRWRMMNFKSMGWLIQTLKIGKISSGHLLLQGVSGTAGGN